MFLKKQHGKQEILQTLKYIYDESGGFGIRLSVFYDLKQVIYPFYASMFSSDQWRLKSYTLIHDIIYAK